MTRSDEALDATHGETNPAQDCLNGDRRDWCGSRRRHQWRAVVVGRGTAAATKRPTLCALVAKRRSSVKGMQDWREGVKMAGKARCPLCDDFYRGTRCKKTLSLSSP